MPVESSRKRRTSISNRASGSFTKAKSADFARLLELIREYYRYDGIRFSARSIGPALRRMLRDETLGLAWLIHHDSEVAGYVILTFNYDLEFGGMQGIVTDLYLREEHRGRGLGRLALDAVAKYCRGHKISAIELQVEHDNKAAQAFYRKLGFRPLSRIVMGKSV